MHGVQTMTSDHRDKKAPDVTQFCDQLKFNRFHALLIFLGMMTLIFDGYYSQIISYVLPNIIAAAGFFVNGVQSAQHTVTGEIYPTFVRSTGVGWALTMGRFGAVCGPLLGGFLQSKGFSFEQYFNTFAVPCLLCAILVCFYRVNVKGETLEVVEKRLSAAVKQPIK